MVNTILDDGGKIWIDVVNPNRKELLALAEKYNLHNTTVKDCLDPTHLPKFEKIGAVTFIILRAYDEKCPHAEDSMQEMTRKVAVFLGDNFLISVHRMAQPFLNVLIDAQKAEAGKQFYLQKVMLDILLSAVETYHQPLEEAETRMHQFEKNIFRSQNTVEEWKEIFVTKTRLMVIKRMLWHTLNTVQKFVPHSDHNFPVCQDLRERIENLQFFVDGLLENLNNLLNVQISLASNSTNTVMRILTLFSAVFMPLTFIVGVYGMNFKHMPELEHPWGYAGVWIIILAVTVGVFAWFWRRGWLR